MPFNKENGRADYEIVYACKLDWEKDLFDFYVESLARIKTLRSMNVTLLI